MVAELPHQLVVEIVNLLLTDLPINVLKYENNIVLKITYENFSYENAFNLYFSLFRQRNVRRY